MNTTISYTQLEKLRARLLGEPITEQSVLLPDFDPSTLAQISNGTYDWKQLPRWAKDDPAHLASAVEHGS